jgi:hypothetical protein
MTIEYNRKMGIIYQVSNDIQIVSNELLFL